MTNKEKLEKVRAEIERTMNWGKEQAAHSYGNVRLLHECREDMCKKFLSFIDYTQEKSINNGLDLGCGVIWKDVEPASDDLEAAIDTYLATYFGGDKEKQYWPFLKKMAINFAEWQKKKDDYAIEIAHMAGEEEGKNIMKQKMMAKAVDAVVKVDAGGYPYIDRTIELYDYDKDIPLAKRGDKYKVILIKEDLL